MDLTVTGGVKKSGIMPLGLYLNLNWEVNLRSEHKLKAGVVCNTVIVVCIPHKTSVDSSGVIIPFFAGIGIGIVITNHLDSNSGIGSSSGTITPL